MTDLANVLNGLGKPPTEFGNDFDSDGDVDLVDLAAVLNGFSTDDTSVPSAAFGDAKFAITHRVLDVFTPDFVPIEGDFQRGSLRDEPVILQIGFFLDVAEPAQSLGFGAVRFDVDIVGASLSPLIGWAPSTRTILSGTTVPIPTEVLAENFDAGMSGDLESITAVVSYRALNQDTPLSSDDPFAQVGRDPSVDEEPLGFLIVEWSGQAPFQVSTTPVDALLLLEGGLLAEDLAADVLGANLLVGSSVIDVDSDGDIDLSDLFTIQNNFGMPAPEPSRDVDGDGVLGLVELFGVQNNFSTFSPPTIPVPEPASGSIASAIAFAIYVRVGRQRCKRI
ncbi:MAG: hypothetical protein AAGF31_05840 [Planctomycetota bacterium]